MSGFQILIDADGAVIQLRVLYENRVPDTVDVTEALIQSFPNLHMELERRRVIDAEVERTETPEV